MYMFTQKLQPQCYRGATHSIKIYHLPLLKPVVLSENPLKSFCFHRILVSYFQSDLPLAMFKAKLGSKMDLISFRFMMNLNFTVVSNIILLPIKKSQIESSL